MIDVQSDSKFHQYKAKDKINGKQVEYPDRINIKCTNGMI